MNKRIFFSGLYPLWTYHLVTELNIIEKHLSEGDDVVLLTCHEAMQSCECNYEHQISECARCIGIRDHGVSLLTRHVERVSFPRSEKMDRAARSLLRDARTISDLKALTYDGINIGLALYSSLVDRFKNTSPALDEETRPILNKITADALTSYACAAEYFGSHRCDTAYIFNGRYAASYALVKAAEKNGVECIIHERTGNLNKVFLFKECIPQDPRIYGRMSNEFWETPRNEEVYQQGVNFFEERPKGELTGWHGFIENQIEGSLPTDWDAYRDNIAVFASSEGEVAAIADFLEGITFPNQLDVYDELFEVSATTLPNTLFYLKLHPNSKGERNAWWESDRLKRHVNLKIILPEEALSSYALLRACNKVIGLMSTICLEATYWGKPSIVLSPAYYSGIDAVYECKSVDEAYELLKDPDLPPKPKKNAIKFGAFMRCFGEDLPFSAAINYYNLSFKGEVLEPPLNVREWAAKCQSRPEAKGLTKWMRDIADRRRLNQLLCSSSD